MPSGLLKKINAVIYKPSLTPTYRCEVIQFIDKISVSYNLARRIWQRKTIWTIVYFETSRENNMLAAGSDARLNYMNPQFLLGKFTHHHPTRIMLVGCFVLIGPLRQYFSLYRADSKREGERKEK